MHIPRVISLVRKAALLGDLIVPFARMPQRKGVSVLTDHIDGDLGTQGPMNGANAKRGSGWRTVPWALAADAGAEGHAQLPQLRFCHCTQRHLAQQQAFRPTAIGLHDLVTVTGEMHPGDPQFTVHMPDMSEAGQGLRRGKNPAVEMVNELPLFTNQDAMLRRYHEVATRDSRTKGTLFDQHWASVFRDTL